MRHASRFWWGSGIQFHAVAARPVRVLFDHAVAAGEVAVSTDVHEQVGVVAVGAGATCAMMHFGSVVFAPRYRLRLAGCLVASWAAIRRRSRSTVDDSNPASSSSAIKPDNRTRSALFTGFLV